MAILTQTTVRDLQAILSVFPLDAPLVIDCGEYGLIPVRELEIRQLRVRRRAPGVEYVEEPQLAGVLHEGVYEPDEVRR